MAQKILGYIELVWTCDSCHTKNPGAIKSCTSCGAPQPLGVKFEQVDPTTFNFIKDEALIRMAQSGPDKHCPYCGTRNLAEAATCVKCGGDLSVGATSRPTGIIGQPLQRETAQSTAQTAKAQQSETAGGSKPKAVSIGLILVLLAFCVFGVFLLTRMFSSDSIQATVTSTRWERVVPIEAYQSVTRSNWEDSVPSDAVISSCKLEYRYNSDQPSQNSEEVCGEPYTVDTGTGVGQVVQDCYYRVYENYCSYERMEWGVVDTLQLNGTDLNAVWPARSLSTTERIGSATEAYTIWFSAGGDDYSLRTSDYELYQQAYPGSVWELEVNGLGGVTSAQPAD